MVYIPTEVHPYSYRSFWFDGSVAQVGNISIETQGTVSVFFDENGERFHDGHARKEALSRGYTDKDLVDISNHDGWNNNNWFAFFDTKTDTVLDATAVSLSEAIETAKRLQV